MNSIELYDENELEITNTQCMTLHMFNTLICNAPCLQCKLRHKLVHGPTLHPPPKKKKYSSTLKTCDILVECLFKHLKCLLQ